MPREGRGELALSHVDNDPLTHSAPLTQRPSLSDVTQRSNSSTDHHKQPSIGCCVAQAVMLSQWAMRIGTGSGV